MPAHWIDVMAQEVWKKRVLIPFWVAQLLICAFYTVVSIVALLAVGAAAANGDFNGDTPTQVIEEVKYVQEGYRAPCVC